ncbi:MAG: HEPN domain-containing protein [Desulfurococcales archaeon]|nr:HEPN domain-containing protein [Desulfurococcales archaeon]
MSGEAVGRLKRRARSFLKAAGLVDDPDLKAFFAEQAMQLHLKAVLLELFGEEARTHSVRELLGLLARRLRDAGYTGEAMRVMEFAAAERLALLEADEAYITARYGLGYSVGEAERLVDLAGRLIALLEEVARRVKLG